MADGRISIGGQALIEGIMMKKPGLYSIAVRRPDGGIDVKLFEEKPSKYAKFPVLRGMVNFIYSLVTGYKSIMYAAEIALEGETEEDKLERFLKKHFGEKATEVLTMIAGVLGAALALLLFMVLPTTFTGIINIFIPLGGFKAAVEGITKLVIFVFYLWAVSKMQEIDRVFRYHGAEHKTISCYEAGQELTVENVRRHTRFHPRCGTSFMFLVLLVSIAVFSFVPWKSTLGRVVMKVIFLPVVVGIAYEILRYTGRNTNLCTKIMAKPGLWFQRLTTSEPDDSMIEVAIASVNAILPETVVAKPREAAGKQTDTAETTESAAADILPAEEQPVEN